jgi:pimeloyl-ACP methyl ester carboxylesterase
LRVTAVQLPLTALEDDVKTVERALAQIKGPTILVGHSYGGVVITEAGNDPKVVGLVYIAAFSLDAGESAGFARGECCAVSFGRRVAAGPANFPETHRGRRELRTGPLGLREGGSVRDPVADSRGCTRRKTSANRRGSQSPAGIWWLPPITPFSRTSRGLWRGRSGRPRSK